MLFESIVSGSVITLKDVNSGSYAEIYSFGALLNQFSAQKNEVAINVIDGFSSPLEATEKLTPYFKSAKLSPYVCRVKDSTFQFDKTDYTLSKYTSNGTALHGLLYNVLFTIAETAGGDTNASVKLEYMYDNKTEGYPFRYKCVIEYKLAAENELTINTLITNLDKKPMPVADGWHPYFSLGDSVNDYQIAFQSKEMLEFDENLIPTGKLEPYKKFASLTNFGATLLDNCFTLDFTKNQPLCLVRNPFKKVQLAIYPTASYPYLQIYTPEHRKSIAIENLSGAPDAFNNGMGLKVLSPDETAVFSTKFVIQFYND